MISKYFQGWILCPSISNTRSSSCGNMQLGQWAPAHRTSGFSQCSRSFVFISNKFGGPGLHAWVIWFPWCTDNFAHLLWLVVRGTWLQSVKSGNGSALFIWSPKYFSGPWCLHNSLWWVMTQSFTKVLMENPPWGKSPLSQIYNPPGETDIRQIHT